MKRIYLYPHTARITTGIKNPYIPYLREALKSHHLVVNEGRPSNIGIFDILGYLRSIDIVFFNWIEDLPGKHRGIFQSIFFILLLQIIKLLRIKIVWTMHNKKSHYPKGALMKKMIFNQMLKKSDLIITHAEEGLSLISEKTPSAFIHHPVRPPAEQYIEEDMPDFDIIIWGSINPYKGVDTFLEFLQDQGILGNYRILIAGKVRSTELLSKLQSFLQNSNNLILMDEFVPEPRLMALIQRSRLVLFTYHAASVLSSGALMDSLAQSTVIIGPNTGAFNDLARLGLLETFEDYPQLLKKIDHHLNSTRGLEAKKDLIKRFIEENSWENFSLKLNQLLKQYAN